MKTPTLFAAALLLLAGCIGRDTADRTKAKTPPVLLGVPIPNVAQLIDTTSTGEAARVTLSIPWSADSVASFYRQQLPGIGFRIVSESGDSLGRTIFAQRNGPPLWIQIAPGRVTNTARFTLIGAVQDPGARGDTGRAAPAGPGAPR